MSATTIHNRAMELADRADHARRSGDSDRAIALLAEAFAAEREAAMVYSTRLSEEPTRSVLFRSAASLALEAGFVRDAEIMIAHGLAGDPPEEIAEELRDLLETVREERLSRISGDDADASRGIELEGTLRMADSNRPEHGVIEIVDDAGERHRIRVPRGEMADIVRPRFDERITVAATRDARGHLLLERVLPSAGS